MELFPVLLLGCSCYCRLFHAENVANLTGADGGCLRVAVQRGRLLGPREVSAVEVALQCNGVTSLWADCRRDVVVRGCGGHVLV